MERFTHKKRLTHLSLLLVLIALVYSNTFHAAWHLDDITNILDNKNVQLTKWSAEAWARSVRPPFSDPSNSNFMLYRPVVMLTFALNWYFGNTEVFGYHLVNTGIHCLTSLLLYLTMIQLMRTPNVRKAYQGKEYFIALTATAFWALHPIQTQAVTYIVQRMTSLATLFFLFGIYSFLKGRSVHHAGRRGVFYGLCLISYILALGSKQNTVVLPAVWLLVEVIFFLDPGYLKTTKGKWVAAGTIAGLSGFFILLIYIWLGNPISIVLNGYQGRPFTFSERILTEFRILIFYFKQILYPIPQQFSILHDFELSKSLVDPWTTLAAILIIAAFIALAVLMAFRNSLLSFALLFFFIGHSVESTIFPLELIFEHRNYLPTLFLFLPIASGLKFLMDRYRRQNVFIYWLLLVFTPMVISGFCVATYTRNMAWASQKSLWEDAMNKAPSYARPYQNVAMALERENRLDEALQLYGMSLALKDPHPRLSRFIALSNMGNIYKKKHDYKNAVQHLTAAVDSEYGPYILRTRYNLVLCLLNNHQEEEAISYLDRFLLAERYDFRFMTAKGFILLRQGKLDSALQYLQQALKQNLNDKSALLNVAMALSAKGAYQRADWYLKRARKRYPDNLIVYLALLQNAIAMKDAVRKDDYLFQITNLFRINDIKHFFIEHAKGYNYIDGILVPVEDSIIIPYLVEYLERRAQKLASD